MLTCQRHHFDLPADVHYLNASTIGANLKTAMDAGQQAILRKSQPHRLTPTDFFTDARQTRQLFSDLINADDPERIALMPSVSYGMATVAKNLANKPGLRAGQQILLVDEEFPSDVYAWEEVCAQKGLIVKTVLPPDTLTNRGAGWNERLLDAITDDTALVVTGHAHWTDGTRFDLVALRERTRAVGAWLVVDGSQSVGVMPLDVQQIRPDALIVGAYKYLLGPYGTSLAYFSETFDNGSPIEANWINRAGSDNFSTLATYQREYRPKAARYNMGEQNNFILLPMLNAALTSLLAWGTAHIADYCGHLTTEAASALAELGFRTEEAAWRSNHLLGVRLPTGLDMDDVKQALTDHHISASVRGSSIRISTHVWNDGADVAALIEALSSVRVSV
ncbi:MAG: aminotransferase class V-fold PLP-dependent enzyme [Bacteroidetes bacterium]|nr:aminotransferase class V-fold PLP-dependent enzyme [Fibrella sp.]